MVLGFLPPECCPSEGLGAQIQALPLLRRAHVLPAIREIELIHLSAIKFPAYVKIHSQALSRITELV